MQNYFSKNHLTVLFLVVGVFFVACSDESGVVVDETSFPSEVATSFELGDCTDERSGNTVFVTEEAAYYVCTESGWLKSIEPNLISSSDINSTSCYGICSSSSQVGVKPSGFYDCSMHHCVATHFLNQEKLIAGEYGEFLDTRDNKVYKVITIGSQTWMAQNLDYDPGDISQSYDSTSVCYMYSADSCAKYGRLYSRYVTIGTDSTKYRQGICPNGWHLPNDSEWGTLFRKSAEWVKSYAELYGYDDFYNKRIYGYAAPKLKAYSGWGKVCIACNDLPTDDEFGFSVLPAGEGFVSGGSISFGLVSVDAFFWSLPTTSSNIKFKKSYAAVRPGSSYKEAVLGENDGIYLYSIRCIKDVEFQ